MFMCGRHHTSVSLDAFVVQLSVHTRHGCGVVVIQGKSSSSSCRYAPPYAHSASNNTVHYIDYGGNGSINRCSWNGHNPRRERSRRRRANAVDDLQSFLSQTQTPHTGSLYGTEGFRRVCGNMSVKSKGVSLKWFKGYDVAFYLEIYISNKWVIMSSKWMPMASLRWPFPTLISRGVTLDLCNRTMESNYGTTVSLCGSGAPYGGTSPRPSHQKAFDHQGFRRISQPKLVIYRQSI
jgi:hypothetical protein